MSSLTSAELKKRIAAILKVADLETTSAKKVRTQLEEETESDLTSRKEEIGKLIQEVMDENADDEDGDEENGAEDEKEDDEEGEEEEEEVSNKHFETFPETKKLPIDCFIRMMKRKKKNILPRKTEQKQSPSLKPLLSLNPKPSQVLKRKARKPTHPKRMNLPKKKTKMMMISMTNHLHQKRRPLPQAKDEVDLPRVDLQKKPLLRKRNKTVTLDQNMRLQSQNQKKKSLVTEVVAIMNPMKDTNLRKLRVAVVEAVVGVVQRKDIGEVMIVSQSQKALHLVSFLDHISVLDFDN